MISYSESYLKQLVSASCCWLLATKVRAKKRDICSSSSISTEIGMNLSDWFYPRQQIEPTKWEKDCWNTSFQQSYTNKVVWELFLQCDAAHRSTLLSIGNLGIDLCCRNIFMTEVTLHHHNACSCVELETGEAVPAAVESDRLRKEKQTEED